MSTETLAELIRRGTEFEEQAATLTEPNIIDCVFMTGASVKVIHDSVVEILGWVHIDDGCLAERRVVVRLAMTRPAANALRKKLAEQLSRDAQ